ncbi:MAG: lipoyl(octanoyl) transferase LipB [Deltaproteobacteria bacterium]|nr:lipoyl(octanoyl) transferase LipB [Deltaproteobacteria bacterium]
MQVLDLGTKSYGETWELQKQLLEKRAQGLIEDTLVLVEHPPVYTVGRAGLASTDVNPSAAQDAPTEIKVRKLGAVPVVEVERGGKLTFHGPGQLVGYPIFDLPHHDLRRYLRDVERALMSILAEETMLPARPCPETLLLEPGQLQTGVWIRDKKIASIGIAVKRWVAYHGFALNLSTDLRYFEAIEPCGFHGSIMTTVEREMGSAVDMRKITDNVKRALVARFSELSAGYQVAAQAPMATTPRPAELGSF